VAPLLANGKSASAASLTSAVVLVTNLSWSADRSPSCRASVSAGDAAARSAEANRPLATPVDVPESEPSQSASEAYPSFACDPVAITTGANSAIPEAADRSRLANRAATPRASSPVNRPGSASRMSWRTLSSAASSWAMNGVGDDRSITATTPEP
jgi:hypothetical protein